MLKQIECIRGDDKLLNWLLKLCILGLTLLTSKGNLFQYSDIPLPVLNKYYRAA